MCEPFFQFLSSRLRVWMLFILTDLVFLSLRPRFILGSKFRLPKKLIQPHEIGTTHLSPDLAQFPLTKTSKNFSSKDLLRKH